MPYLIKLFWKVFVFLQSTKPDALWWKVSVILQTQQDALVEKDLSSYKTMTRCFGEKGFVILQKHDKMLW